MCHFQALRYPYFQVGHPLGSTAHSLQESGKSQKDVLEKAAAPPHVKPVPPAQPPAKPHTRISSRQHQAGQPPQHLVYPYKAEAPRTDHLPEDKPSPLLLPSLHPKHPQAVSRTVHSGALSGCSGKPKRIDSQAGTLPQSISTPRRESSSLCTNVGSVASHTELSL